jgi:peptidoglycan/LPS O-acetylase OafA/YrhL
MLKGGFVGVDVFFVISGFLISGLLLDDLARGRLFLLDFYQRRILRIFPTLLLVLTVTLAGGWAIFLPEDYAHLAASALSATLFVSNHYFLTDIGYFSAALEAQPLLHTWSLAVEEQYYLLFPLYLLAIRRASPRWRLGATIALWLASFALSVAIIRFDPKLAFYAFPTRAWELLTGVLVSMGVVRAPKSLVAARAAALAGLLLIGAATLCYSADTSFPGIAAVPPVLGSALVIWAGLSASLPTLGALAVRPAVYIGLISYPLYLWHFPAIGLVRYVSLGPPSGRAMAVAVGISFVLAALSYELLEKPIRKAGRERAPRYVLPVGLGAMATIGVFAIAVYVGRGFEFRIPSQQAAIAFGLTDHSVTAQSCMNRKPEDVEQGRICILGGGEASPNTLVWGDSFAEAALPGIQAAAARNGTQFLFAGRHGCEPHTGRGQDADSGRKCRAFSAAALDLVLSRPGLRKVLLVLRWPAGSAAPDSAGDPAVAVFERRLDELVDTLSRAGKTVWISGPLPVAHYNVPRALWLQSLGFAREKRVASTRAEFDQSFSRAEVFMHRLEQYPNVYTLRLVDHFCDLSLCKVIDNRSPFFFDEAHLSTTGAKLVIDEFEAALR